MRIITRDIIFTGKLKYVPTGPRWFSYTMGINNDERRDQFINCHSASNFADRYPIDVIISM